MRTKAKDSVLAVKGVNLQIDKKVILNNIRTTARSGDLLAIMGPTGSGKTTLLNIISGRLKPDSGKITLNDHEFTKRHRRRLAFVQQQDVFFSQLTLWETLYFTAQIRLPSSLSEAEKRQKIDEIIETLDLGKCVNTVIGDIFSRGLSGGEKKRASIACELLMDPDILLLDEPTSGLDSSTALSLMSQMKIYAEHFNKTIISTIHQPSSQIYYLFHNILLLINGHEAYFGRASDALDYFERLGIICDAHFNPADFLLQIAKSDEETVERVISTAETTRFGEECELNVAIDTEKKTADSDVDNHAKENGVRGVNHTLTETTDSDKVIVTVPEEENVDAQSSLIKVKSGISDAEEPLEMSHNRWPTSWWRQYYMLSWRGFRQSKGILSQGYAIVQTMLVSLATGLIYWQIELDITTVRDVMGLLFFVCSYWTFSPAFEIIIGFQEERGVISKERAAGSYRLSAYYISKMTCDLPLTFLLPTAMYVMLYTMSGIGGVAEFFSTYPILLLQVLLAQAFGFVLAALFKQIKPALTTMVSYNLSAFMIGGFFTQRVPSWLKWAKYVSTMLYPFGAVSTIILKDLPPTLCNETSITEFPQCKSQTYVYIEDILHDAGLTQPLYNYIWPIVLVTILLRIIGYFILRFKRQKML